MLHGEIYMMKLRSHSQLIGIAGTSPAMTP
jgi:hypothetical protein